MDKYLERLKVARNLQASEQKRVDEFRRNSSDVKGSKTFGKKSDAELAALYRLNAAKENIQRIEASFRAGETQPPTIEQP